jgi:uncharacterized protein YndB with AHSA1/START domain
MSSNFITISTLINCTAEKAWHSFNTPEHIMQWNFAADTWHCPASKVNLIVGGKLCHTMAAKDGSFSFDLEAEYTQIQAPNSLHFTMLDGRKVITTFTDTNGGCEVTQQFEPETENPIEMQQEGWQAILNNFKLHSETL